MRITALTGALLVVASFSTSPASAAAVAGATVEDQASTAASRASSRVSFQPLALAAPCYPDQSRGGPWRPRAQADLAWRDEPICSSWNWAPANSYWRPTRASLTTYPARTAYTNGGRWCYTRGTNVDCSQPSFESCLFSNFGAGGSCYQDETRGGPWRSRAAPADVAWRNEPVRSSWNWSRSYASWYGEPSYGRSWYGARASLTAYQAEPASAGSGRWCYTRGSTVDCSQLSFEMCQFSTLGVGGYCYPDQSYWGPARPRLRTGWVRVRHHRTKAEPVAAMTVEAKADNVGGSAARQAFAMADVTPGVETDAHIGIDRAAVPIGMLPRFNIEKSCRQAAKHEPGLPGTTRRSVSRTKAPPAISSPGNGPDLPQPIGRAASMRRGPAAEAPIPSWSRASKCVSSRATSPRTTRPAGWRRDNPGTRKGLTRNPAE